LIPLLVMTAASLVISGAEFLVVDFEFVGNAFDAPDYVSIARNLEAGNGYLITDGATFASDTPTAYRTPGYPLLLLVMLELFGDPGFIVATYVLQNILLASLPLLFFTIAFHVVEHPEYSLFAAVAAFFYVPFRFLASVTQPEFVALWCLLVAFALLLGHLRSPSTRKVLAFSILFGVAILVRQSLVPGLLVFAYPLPRLLDRRRLLMAMSVPLLLISAWVVRNAVVLDGFPVFATNGGLNFYHGQHPQVDANLAHRGPYLMRMRELMAEGLTEVEADRQLFKEGREFAWERGFGGHVGRALEKLWVTFGDRMPQYSNELFYLLLPMAVIAARRRVWVTILVAAQLAYGWFVYGFHTDLRALYYLFALDVLVVHLVGLVVLFALVVAGNSAARILAVFYFPLVLQAVVFVPLDRNNFVCDFVLVVAYGLTPWLCKSLAERISRVRSSSNPRP
jgi:hypothetical protein